MKNLKQSILLNVNAFCKHHSPDGVQLDWLASLVDEDQEKVREAARELVADGEMQKPFEDLYLKKGAKVLIAKETRRPGHLTEEK